MTTRWQLPVEEDADTGDMIVTFPPDLLSAMGWKEGDQLKWSKNDDDSWTLKKVEDNE